MKTECPYSDNANAFVADELEPRARIDFETHLATCEECRDAVESAQQIIDFLQSAPQVESSRDLTPVILARIRSEEKTIRPAVRWSRFAAAAALVALCASAVVFQNRVAENPSSSQLAVKAPSTDAGVTRAVHWFLRTQEADGSWSAERWGGHKNYAPALTALPLLALLSGDATMPGHEEAIVRAVGWLVKQQNPDGTFGTAVQGAPYNHSIATLALLHAYEHSHDVVPKNALDAAVNALVTVQAQDGSWGYRYSPLGDRSITQWHIQALDFAAQHGWESVRPLVDRGLHWLSTHSVPLDDSVEPVDSTSAVLARATERSARSRDALDFYQTYFAVAALEHESGTDAKARLAAIRQDILNHQVAAGSEGGSWSPDDHWGGAGGRLYSTALASLSLRSDRSR